MDADQDLPMGVDVLREGARAGLRPRFQLRPDPQMAQMAQMAGGRFVAHVEAPHPWLRLIALTGVPGERAPGSEPVTGAQHSPRTPHASHIPHAPNVRALFPVPRGPLSGRAAFPQEREYAAACTRSRP
ncbi:hypothetical protein ACGFW5_21490 [Streptomyces sp. NPDC048416]|uniref:hypothetical protein n=1 Tax=Streptomyces sp. NPDC048416 TaxID=3365546 RepID=UPI003718D0DD